MCPGGGGGGGCSGGVSSGGDKDGGVDNYGTGDDDDEGGSVGLGWVRSHLSRYSVQPTTLRPSTQAHTSTYTHLHAVDQVSHQLGEDGGQVLVAVK